MKCPLCQQNIRIQGKFCPKCGKQIFGLPVRPEDSLDAPPPSRSAPPSPPQPSPPAPPPRAPFSPPTPPGRRRSAFAPPPPGGSSDDDTLEITLEPMDEVADLGPPRPRPAAPPVPMAGSAPLTTATDAEIGKTCPYCRFPVKIGAPVVVCDACKTPHHQDCWQENGGCTSYGCARAPGARPQPVATAAGFPGIAPAAPRRGAGSAIADALILAELDRSAGQALTYAIVGIFCCPIFSIVGALMGFSTLSSITRSGLLAPSARTKAIIAIVIGLGTILLALVTLLAQAQGGVRYR